MPRLAKGGKWVFGWVTVGSGGGLGIPREAYREYGFRAGDEVIFLKGSRTSGGLSVGRADLIPLLLRKRALGRGRMGRRGRVNAPSGAGVRPGDRLLAVRGSGMALGLLARGPIYEEAIRHPELETPCHRRSE